MSTLSDSLGMILTITIGGIGMFLLVLAISFLAAQILVKNREVFADEDGLMECEVYECGEVIDVSEEIETDRDIFIIQTDEGLGNKVDNSLQISANWTKTVNIKEQISSKILNFMSEKMVKLY